jgi:hypothetical protein
MRLTTVPALILATAALLLLGLVLVRCRHGLDFSDEGFYLNSIADPWLYRSGVTQFGVIYYPVFKATGGDIGLMRQFNVFLTWMLSVLVAWFCVASPSKLRAVWFFQAALAVSLAGTSLLYLSLFWLPTPSYNSLALQGLLIVAIGLAIVDAKPSTAIVTNYREATAASLVGLGGALVFLAKPPSAVLLAAAMLPLFIVVFSRAWLMTGLAAMVALVFVLAVGLALDGDISAFISRYRRGMEFAEELAPAHSFFGMLRLEALGAPRRAWLGFVLLGIATWAVLFLARSRRPAMVVWLLGLVAFASLLGTIGLMLKPELVHYLPSLASYSNIAVSPPLLVATLFAIGLGWQSLTVERGLRTLLIAAFFFVCPYLFAVGTGNRVTTQALGALVFWPLAAAQVARCMLPQETLRYVYTVVAAAVVPITACLVTGSMQQPYRQNAPLHTQLEPIAVGPSQKSLLFVDRESARYLRELRSSVPGGSDRLRGTPMLDFTGGHPATVYALGAKAIALPWLIGGYAGSIAVADRAVARVPCEILAQAWLLTSPGSQREISLSVLMRQGLDQYGPVAGPLTGPWNGNASVQYLLAPRADTVTAVAQCSALRRNAQLTMRRPLASTGGRGPSKE